MEASIHHNWSTWCTEGKEGALHHNGRIIIEDDVAPWLDDKGLPLWDDDILFDDQVAAPYK